MYFCAVLSSHSEMAIVKIGANEAIGQLPSALNTSDEPSRPHEKPDIEHATVQDDPREWSRTRKVSLLNLTECIYLLTLVKYITLATVASAALIATLGANIYNRESDRFL